jgi:3-hydroxyisobutyrate dehydrogenase-like beta-hydroxyacid dehydrogenase
MASTVAFIGLGIMGGRMVKNVLKAGYLVRAYNRTAHKADEAKTLGATIVDSAKDAAMGADAVITMVSDPPALAAVLEGPSGVFAGCRPGALIIDMSTVDPGTSQTMSAQATSRGLRYVDAPVTGGVAAAAQGGLTIMVGATAEDFALAKPLLETMGKKILHIGPAGHGSIMKLIVNLVGACIITSAIEGLALATKAGVDPQLVVEVLTERSPLIGRTAPKILSGDFSANFPLKLAHKDVQLALSAARSLGVPMFSLATVAQFQAAALAKGYGELDQTATMQVLEDLIGVKARAR